MRIKSVLFAHFTLAAVLFAGSVSGGTDTAAIQKASYIPASPINHGVRNDIATSGHDVLVFTAPPRETAAEGIVRYAPIAEYLSKVTGKKIIYRHPGTWGVYRTKMLRGEYDLVFDGPHFNSYRADKLNHNILVKIPKRHEFVVIVNKNETRFSDLQKMGGRTFCTHAPPNLGTLVLLNQFTNPARQPVIINTKGWKKIYDGVVSGRCTAGILPILNLKKYDAAHNQAKILFKAEALPNQAFSAGPRVSAEDQAKIAAALVAPEAATPTAKLRAAYKVGANFAQTNNQEYRGIAAFLKNEWGYY